MHVAIVGADGQLGTDLAKILSDWNPVRLSHAEIDIRASLQVRDVLFQIRPHAVINTAAFNRVDDCEDDPETAFAVNAYGARNLARVCSILDCIMVHISTDYVFGGEKTSPYTEADSPNPLSVYGVSKLAGEFFVRSICPKHFVVRTSGLYGIAGSKAKGGNFVQTMIRLAREGKAIRVVDDQVLTPTYTRDLAEKLKELLPTNFYGLYHVTNSGQCSWYDFAAQIFALTGLTPDLVPITSGAFGAKARRPKYSVLAADRLSEHGFEQLRDWKEALKDYLRANG